VVYGYVQERNHLRQAVVSEQNFDLGCLGILSGLAVWIFCTWLRTGACVQQAPHQRMLLDVCNVHALPLC
jgi:hypothetical protein